MVDKWESRFQRKPARTTMRVAVGVVVFVLLLGAGIWVVNVVTSPARGAGDAYAQRNSAGNWVTAQRQFNDSVNSFNTYKVQIGDASKAYKAWQSGPHQTEGMAAYTDSQHGQNLNVTLTGLTQNCQNTAAKYNTDSQSYLSQDFKDAGLPYQLDPSTCSLAAS